MLGLGLGVPVDDAPVLAGFLGVPVGKDDERGAVGPHGLHRAVVEEDDPRAVAHLALLAAIDHGGADHGRLLRGADRSGTAAGEVRARG